MIRDVVRVSVFLLAILAMHCREIQPFQPASPPQQGYALDGTVITMNGVPIESVAVSIAYGYELVSRTAKSDTIPLVIPNPPKALYVDVYDLHGRHIKELFSGYLPPGRVTRIFYWVGTNDSGKPVPSGEYLTRYVVDTATIKIVPVVTDQHVTAYTDANGNFTLSSDNLPIDQIFDIYEPNGTFDGSYAISSTIYLFFMRGSLRGMQPSTLEYNNVYHGAYTLG